MTAKRVCASEQLKLTEPMDCVLGRNELEALCCEARGKPHSRVFRGNFSQSSGSLFNAARASPMSWRPGSICGQRA